MAKSSAFQAEKRGSEPRGATKPLWWNGNTSASHAEDRRVSTGQGYHRNIRGPAARLIADHVSDIHETPGGRKLDFSQFHPLDHRPFDERCRSFYGGGVRHLQLWWWYKFDYKPDQLWHRWVLCRLNRHERSRFKRRPAVDAPWEHGHLCRWCLTMLDE